MGDGTASTGPGGKVPVAMGITIPFAMLRISNYAMRPIVHQAMPSGIFLIACKVPGQQRRDDGRVVRHAKFNFRPLCVDRDMLYVCDGN